MQKLDRITFEPGKMGGKPCILGMRVTVGTVVGLGAGQSNTVVMFPIELVEALNRLTDAMKTK